MKRLIRRLSRVVDSSQCTPLMEGKEEGGGVGRRRRRVPEGYVPVYVGEEMERFAVRAELLGRPAFVKLLRRSAQEYGYDQRGVLRIPCPVLLFRQVLHFLASGSDGAGDLAVEELFRSLPDESRSTCFPFCPS